MVLMLPSSAIEDWTMSWLVRCYVCVLSARYWQFAGWDVRGRVCCLPRPFRTFYTTRSFLAASAVLGVANNHC